MAGQANADAPPDDPQYHHAASDTPADRVIRRNAKDIWLAIRVSDNTKPRGIVSNEWPFLLDQQALLFYNEVLSPCVSAQA